RKVRTLFKGEVIAGFAGSVADAFTLFEKFEGKLEEYNGNLMRAAVELAKEWRSDKMLRQLEAMLIVMNRDSLLHVSGIGEVSEQVDGRIAFGSCGNYSLRAGQVLKDYTYVFSTKVMTEKALTIVIDICVFKNE